jgi:hypothetical protein
LKIGRRACRPHTLSALFSAWRLREQMCQQPSKEAVLGWFFHLAQTQAFVCTKEEAAPDVARHVQRHKVFNAPMAKLGMASARYRPVEQAE